jgi:type IV pilus assembly protein PilC
MIQTVEKLLFTRELAVILKSGVSLRDALISLSEQSQFSALRKVVDAIIADVENGQTLATAISRHPKVFDHLFVNLVMIGEETGSLPENMDFLAVQLEKKYQLKKTIQGILLYPAIVFLTATILAGLISVFILPKLVRLFNSFSVELPLSTRVLLSVASFMRDHGVVFFLSLIGFFIAIRLITLTSLVRPYWHRLLLHIPVIGVFLRNVYLTQFFRDLGVMLGSGLPISQALLAEERASRNFVFSDMARGLYQGSLEGRSLSTEMAGVYGTSVPSVVIRMIAAGEQSGKLGETFLYLGDFLDAEVDRCAKNFTVVLEPVLLIVIASVVAFLAIAILSPIYSLTGSIHR